MEQDDYEIWLEVEREVQRELWLGEGLMNRTRSGVAKVAALITSERHRTEGSDRRTNGVI
jgi:hypothetical protein